MREPPTEVKFYPDVLMPIIQYIAVHDDYALCGLGETVDEALNTMAGQLANEGIDFEVSEITVYAATKKSQLVKTKREFEVTWDSP